MSLPGFTAEFSCGPLRAMRGAAPVASSAPAGVYPAADRYRARMEDMDSTDSWLIRSRYGIGGGGKKGGGDGTSTSSIVCPEGNASITCPTGQMAICRCLSTGVPICECK